MGLNIFLHTVPSFPPEQWEALWDESTAILEAFPVPLCRWLEEDSAYGKRLVISTRLIENDAAGNPVSWTVSGDLVSGKMAEKATLPRILENHHCPSDDDPLWLDSNSIDKDGDWVFNEFGGELIFGGKTQGFPFHNAVLAVAMLIESRFPGKVFAHGDFNLQSCEAVRDWLAEILDEPVQLPAAVDPANLWNRLEGLFDDSDVLLRRFRAAFQGSATREARWLFKQSRETAMKIYAANLAGYNEINQIGASSIIQSVLESTQHLDTVFELISQACHQTDNDRSGFDDENLLRQLCRHHVTTSEFEDEELRRLTGYLQTDCTIEETFSRLFFQMAGGLPTRWDFSIDAEDLLESFASRSPNSRKKYAAIIEECEQANRDELKKLSEIVEAGSEAVSAEVDNFDDGEIDSFEGSIRFDAARQQKKFADFEADSAFLAESAYRASESPEASSFLPAESTHAELREKICEISFKEGIGFPEKTWQAIDACDDRVILRILVLMTVSLCDSFGSHGPYIMRIFREPDCWERLKRVALDSAPLEEE